MKNSPTSQSIIEVDNQRARDYFLKSNVYCRLDLPSYFNFQNLLDEVNRLYIAKFPNSDEFLNSDRRQNLGKLFDVNYSIFANKDSSHSWRKLQLIHPLLYVHLVHTLTESANWAKLQTRFNDFRANTKIECHSLPVISISSASDTEEQIINWYQNIEQSSIRLGMEFTYLFDTDIADCYGSIYTHSLAWAVETKAIAKSNYSQSLLGNKIDKIIQNMQYGQTNGVPQGSVLIDFVAEILLGYIDEELSVKLQADGIDDYKILRYRDDYRIFVNNYNDGSRILKLLSEVLLELGLHLNANKTKSSNDVITDAIKPDKLAWAKIEKPYNNNQKFLLTLREHAKDFPNSGTLKKELQRFYSSFKKENSEHDDFITLISLICDIMYNNPSTYSIGFAIISLLLYKLNEPQDKIQIINIINKKFNGVPNTGIMQVWFQRMLVGLDSQHNITFTERLCLLEGSPNTLWGSKSNKLIWNNSWIEDIDIVNAIEKKSIFDNDQYYNLDPIIELNEFALFDYSDSEDEEGEIEEL